MTHIYDNAILQKMPATSKSLQEKSLFKPLVQAKNACTCILHSQWNSCSIDYILMEDTEVLIEVIVAAEVIEIVQEFHKQDTFEKGQ